MAYAASFRVMRAEPWGYYLKRAREFDADTPDEVRAKAQAWALNHWPDPDPETEPEICPIKRKVRRERYMAALIVEPRTELNA